MGRDKYMKRGYSVNPQASFARMSIEQIAMKKLTEYLFGEFGKKEKDKIRNSIKNKQGAKR
jgi:hypothetical protein